MFSSKKLNINLVHFSAHARTHAAPFQLDKLCLDTLLFRAAKKDRAANLTNALKNIFRLLKPGGAFVCISTRKQMKAKTIGGGRSLRMRDFRGFSEVTRKTVEAISENSEPAVEGGEIAKIVPLVGKTGNNERDGGGDGKGKGNGNGKGRVPKRRSATLYVYTCLRNNDYKVEDDGDNDADEFPFTIHSVDLGNDGDNDVDDDNDGSDGHDGDNDWFLCQLSSTIIIIVGML